MTLDLDFMKLDLFDESGLSIGLRLKKETLDLELQTEPEDPVRFEASVRTLGELKDVLYKPPQLPSNTPAYFMFRNVHRPSDVKLFERANLRYNITAISPIDISFLGGELIKTFGHYHPLKSGTTFSYPEVYQVMSGVAHFLIQSVDGKKVKDVRVIEAKKLDTVVIPPNYGHITINAEKITLVTADLSSRNATQVDYETMRLMHGGCYYEIPLQGKVREAFVKNSNYSEVPEFSFEDPAKMSRKFNLGEKPIYTQLVENPEAFDFLNNPERFW